MTQLALSTMWMQKRHQSLDEFFDVAREVGFDAFELSHHVSEELVQADRLPVGDILKVHAACPTNPRTRNAQLSALDKEERSRAVEGVMASIQLAEQIGARFVVVHAGRVVVNPMLETELRALYDQGLKDSEEYGDLKAELGEERSRSAERHLEATLWSLERLANVADSAGVKLCLENRLHYYEIPLPDELDLLLQELAGPVSGCFDTGHAYVLDELGFVGHGEWLSGFSEQLACVDLHDVRVVRERPDPSEHMVLGTGLQDHVVPSTGVVDFAQVLRRVPEQAIFTCEFDWYHSPDEVKAGLAYLREQGF
ncbi:MAG: sugar phosphate isomerase/epimerase [Anaerolineales bacterium]|nr:MAG: sugar phosphate isomerase/epimerase [Anaerolineales bacterium]